MQQYNKEYEEMVESSANTRMLKRYMEILQSNYGKKREETIKAIQDAGYTVEDIKRIKEKYCHRDVTLKVGYNEREEIASIVEKLKGINEKIIYGKSQQDISKINDESITQGKSEEGSRSIEESQATKKDAFRESIKVHTDVSQTSKRDEDEKLKQRAKEEFIDFAPIEEMFRQKKDRSYYYEIHPTSDGPVVSKNYDFNTQTRAGQRERQTSRDSRHPQRRNIKSKARTTKSNKFARRLAAGALAISVLAGSIALAVHKNNEYKEDVENRIEYVDNIIDKGGTAKDYQTYCSIDFTDEELNKFLEVEEKIDSFEGKESTDMSIVEVISTAESFKEIYQDIVRERLEEGYGYSIDENEIKVVRERDDLDGKPGDYNEHGHISQIGYMTYMASKNIPKELRNSIIAAYGEQGIEKPALTVDQLIYMLDNGQIDKAEASKLLSGMLDDAKELMTRQYEETEEYGELKEIDTTYTKTKEKEKEQEKLEQQNKTTTAQVIQNDDNER